MILKVILLSYTHSLTNLSKSGVESRLVNNWWLLMFTRVKKAYGYMHTVSTCAPGHFYLHNAVAQVGVISIILLS